MALNLGIPPADDKGRIEWCVRAIQEIVRESHGFDPAKAADSFTPSNVTETRALDGAAATLAQVRSVLATFLQDLKKRGQKRTGG